jgi:nanoRNase/pAp phosphatase (c-di-AMP/oligoRNAs hydrolase)
MPLRPEQQALETLLRARRVLVATQAHPSPAAVAAAFAAAQVVRGLGLPADIVLPGADPASLPAFLREAGPFLAEAPTLRNWQITVDLGNTPIRTVDHAVQGQTLQVDIQPGRGLGHPAEPRLAPGTTAYGALLAIDCPSREALGPGFANQREALFAIPTVVIDQDPANEAWGHVNLVDPAASATGEILFRLAREWRAEGIDAHLATLLLANIVAKTRSFRTPNPSPAALHAAATLVDLGADRERIVRELWRTRSAATLRLWGVALSRLSRDPQLPLGWSSVLRADLASAGIRSADAAGVLDELMADAADAAVSVLFIENDIGGVPTIEAHLHADPPFSAIALARPFGGDGSRTRASFRLDASPSLADAQARALEEIRAAMGGKRA